MQRSKFAAVFFALLSTIFATAALAVVVDDASDTLHSPGCATTGASPRCTSEAVFAMRPGVRRACSRAREARGASAR